MRKKRRNRRPFAEAKDALVEQRVFWAFLLIAICLGGGGRGANIANLFVQICALAMIAINFDRVREGWVRIGFAGKAVVLLAIALPLLQLVPLPPALWTALPGRALLVETQELALGDLRWSPISMVPGVTVLALTGLVAPFAVFLMAASLRRDESHVSLAILTALGVACVVLGTIQLLAGGSLVLHDSGDGGYLHGFFANHNSTGIFLVVALCALIELTAVRRLRGPVLAVAAGVGILLAVAIILTQSRSSLALLILPVGLAAFHAVGTTRLAGNRILGLVAAGAVALSVAGIGALAISSNERLAQTIERFETTANLRPALWSDARTSAERFFPVGSGMGTFDEVFQLDESLETLYPARAGRAHSDYLEILVEAGVAGILVLLSWVAYVGVRIFQGDGSHQLSRPFYLAVAGSFAAQSLLDYPLRNQALLCVAALILGLLAGSRANGRTREKELPGV